MSRPRQGARRGCLQGQHVSRLREERRQRKEHPQGCDAMLRSNSTIQQHNRSSLLPNFTVSLVHAWYKNGDGGGGGGILESSYCSYCCCCKFEVNTPRNATATPPASSRRHDAESVPGLRTLPCGLREDQRRPQKRQ